MKAPLIILTLLLAGCTFETHVSGVIIDESTGLPVRDVMVRTIKDLNGMQLEFAETKSSEHGKLDLRFTTNSVRDDKVLVELSKPGFQTNMYTCYKDKANDTLMLRRQ